MASCTVFEEDVIHTFDENGYKIGLVLESSEYVSSDEEDDPNFDYDRVKKGTVRVAWHPAGLEEVSSEKNIGLTDRSLMPGDVVRRLIRGQDSQRGYVRATSIACHLQLLGTNKIITNVDSRELQPLRYWDPEPGDVTIDSWVGKIEHVNEEVTLRFPDGALCRVCDDEFVNELFDFEDLHESRPRDSEFCVNDYYIGQQFRGDLYDLATATWLKTTNNHNQHTAKKSRGKEVLVTVDKVETKSIDIHWLCRGYAKVENPLAKLDAPPRTLHREQIKSLKKLDCFESCSVQVGDKAYYTIKNTDLIRVFSGHKNTDKSLLHRLLTDMETLPEDKGEHTHYDLTIKNYKNEQERPNQAECGNRSEAKISNIPCSDDGKCEKVNNLQGENDKSKFNMDCVSEAVQKVELNHVAKDTGTKDEVAKDNQIVGKDNHEVAKNNHEIAKDNHMDEDVEIEDGEDDSEYEDEEGSVSDAGSSCSGHSSTSNTSPSLRRRHKKATLPIYLVRRKRQRRTRKPDTGFQQNLKPGDRVAVEVIYTLSLVDVMWQDGVIEKNIKSTELFPIHHLDELEFFPGDFVVSSQEVNSTDSSYGVVEKVDHGARTCFIRWMKPYQVGKSNKPDESIVSEEVSVYDIKDHSEFKFRPGHVVVRVGGYEETHTEAAGQVYEMCQDGRIHIRWADASYSYCYPQELFLIGDELSDLGSDLDASSGDSEEAESEDGSDVSWETEEEEEVDDPDADDPNNEETQENLSFEPDLKSELDKLLETARCTLQRLEEEFSHNVDISPWIIHCYREILRINRNCKDLDRMLSSHYFCDTKLTHTVSVIRKELKREKAAKMARQVLELFETNCRQVKAKEEGDKAEGQDTKSRKRSRNKDDNRSDGHEHQSSQSMVELGASGGGSDINLTMRDTSDMATQTDESSPESIKDGNTPSREVAVQTLSSSHSTKAKDLCQTACRLLKEQIMKVHEDLAKKWQKLRELGILKALGHEDNDEEEATEADIKALVSSVSKTNQSAMTACQIIANSGLMGDVTGLSSEASSEAQSATSILIESSLSSASAPCITGSSLASPSTSSQAPDASVTAEPGPSSQDMRSGLTLSLPSTTVPATPTSPCGSITSMASPAAAAGDVASPDMEEMRRRVWEPQTPQTPAEIRAKILYNVDGFQVMSNVPASHRFASSTHQPADSRAFFSAIKKELKMLRTSLPLGIYVKGFEDRMDLYSVMIMGPTNTPYEDGLFFFDVQLPNDYPTSPPSVHYIAFCSDRLNPNLYEDGKVCVSLLGTWTGRGTEVWTNKSSLLQVLISIQGLILVSEPYYNEAGYEKQKGSQQAAENSCMYNEMAICKLVLSMARIASKPPVVFELEVLEHMRQYGFKMVRRLDYWLKLSDQQQGEGDHVSEASDPPGTSVSAAGDPPSACLPVDSDPPSGCLPGPAAAAGGTHPLEPPEFPLFPCSRGFRLTLRKHLQQLRESLLKMGLTPTP